MIDTVGAKNARIEISKHFGVIFTTTTTTKSHLTNSWQKKQFFFFLSSSGMIKIAAPRTACEVVDAAI